MVEPSVLGSGSWSALVDAIRSSWSATTSATPDLWSPDLPSIGQCDVSAFLVWQQLGGCLVLGEVRVDGVLTEHHHWNRIDGVDVDLTRTQFPLGVDIRAVEVLDSHEIEQRRGNMRQDIVDRLALLRASVDDQLRR